MQRLHFIYNKNTAIFYVSHFSSLFLNNNPIFFPIANPQTEEQNIKVFLVYGLNVQPSSLLVIYVY